MHGGPYCSNTGRVFAYHELAHPAIVVIVADPAFVDRASTEQEAAQVRGQPMRVIYDDGIDYGPGLPLNLEMSAFILASSFDRPTDE